MRDQITIREAAQILGIPFQTCKTAVQRLKLGEVHGGVKFLAHADLEKLKNRSSVGAPKRKASK